MKLSELRERYLQKTCIEHKCFGGRNADKPFEYISDKELVEKLNSKKYKLHPKLPIIVNKDGSEIYDVRDGFKTIIRLGCCKQKRPKIKISGYEGQKYVHVIVVESWKRKLVSENEDVHHIDFDRYNNNYKNLLIINKDEHKRIHNFTKKK